MLPSVLLNNARNFFALHYVALIAIALLGKTLIGFWNATVDLQHMQTHFAHTTKQSYLEGINIDEYEMARTAYHYIHSGRFISDNHFGRPNFTGSTYQLSAFRPKFNVMLHVMGLQWYERYTHTTISSANKIPDSYFGYYCWWIALCKSLLFAVSVWFFYQLSCLALQRQQVWAAAATLAYICYPSVMWYMGWLDILENIGMPLLVMVLSALALSFQHIRFYRLTDSIGIGLLAALSCLVRPHLISVFQLLFIGYGLFAAWYYYQRRSMPHNMAQMTILALSIVVAHIPIFVQNYYDFGQILLSTQPGLEFFQGHNPFARGTWNPYLWQQHQDDFAQIFNDPHLRFYNEKQELDFYFKQALYWIKANPAAELWLMIRKTAIYFFPFNYLHQSISLFIALTHLCFAAYLSFSVFNKQWRETFFANHAAVFLRLVIFAPIVACYTISMVFFVCERWRYYAEPFMLLCAVVFCQQMYQQQRRQSALQHTTPYLIHPHTANQQTAAEVALSDKNT